MATKIKANNSAFRAMAVGPELRAACFSKATQAAGIARGLSEDFQVSGDYLDSFYVTSDTVRLTTEFGEHDVAAGTLTNRSEHAAAVEWGNKHDHHPHHVLGRTLDQLDHD